MPKNVYRLPLVHCIFACAASFILGFGIGYSVFKTSQPQPQPLAQLPSATPSPTPSGLPEPTPTAGMIQITVYFDNVLFNPNAASCSAVFPVKRVIPVTNVALKAALDQLFAGPSEQEMAFGYSSVFSSKTKDLLKSISVKNGILHLDLDRTEAKNAVESGANSSCGNAQFLAAIEKTAKEFKGIDIVDPANFTIAGSHSTYLNLLGL